MLLTRYYTFADRNQVTPAQMNAIQDVPVNLLSGVSTDIHCVLSSTGAAAGWTLNQTGAGPVQTWFRSNKLRSQINNSGQYEAVDTDSWVSTAVYPPLIVASTTVVTNLHVEDSDKLGGVAAADYAVLSDYYTTTQMDAIEMPWVQMLYLSTADQVEGQPAFIVPDTNATYKWVGIKYTQSSGTAVGDTVLPFKHYNSSGTLQTTKNQTVASAASAGVVYTNTFGAAVSLSAGDYIKVTPNTSDGKHANMQFCLFGTYEFA